MQPLFALLHTISKMSPELESHLAGIIRHAAFQKGQVILRDGQSFEHIYFIEKGMVRIYHVNEVEVTTWFLIENDIFISPESFFRQLPANENIEALEDCICWGITRRELEETCRMFPEFYRHRTWLTEEYYLRDLRRRKELQLSRAVERYASLAEGRPDLLYRVPAELLPSYIGVAKSTFHGARGKFLRKGKQK